MPSPKVLNVWSRTVVVLAAKAVKAKKRRESRKSSNKQEASTSSTNQLLSHGVTKAGNTGETGSKLKRSSTAADGSSATAAG